MQRPVFLNLFQMKFPAMAVASILHRISGVIIFLGLPFALYLLDHSLRSSAEFAAMQSLMMQPAIKFLLWVLLSASAFHVLAGIRHMIMDCGFGEHLSTARMTAFFIMLLEIAVMVLLGVWLWG